MKDNTFDKKCITCRLFLNNDLKFVFYNFRFLFYDFFHEGMKTHFFFQK